MIQNLIQHIDRLIQQRPAAKTALAPFRELALLMVQVNPDSKPVEVERGIRDIKQQEDFPLFSREDMTLDFSAASDLLKKFLEHLGVTDRDDREGLKMALKKADSTTEWSRNLLKAILNQDEKTLSLIAKEVDLDPMVLQFLGQVALTPSIYALRDALSANINTDGWDYGYCPLCGSQPNMAYFAKTGKRYLHCELCGEEWAFSRIRCPFCDNHDQKTLGYFEAEEEEGFRVYFCRECMRYLKTIDKKAFEEMAPLELENLATIHLNILASQHGFQ